MKIKHLMLSLGVALAALIGLFALLGNPSSHVVAQSTLRYVSPEGEDKPSCTSPSDPCRTVQYAIRQAEPGDEIRVATGVYTATHEPVASVDKSLLLRGGWDREFTLQTPNPAIYTTTLDGRGIDRVVMISPTSKLYLTVTVEGFEITGGDATKSGHKGGGLYATLTELRLLNNLIWNNFAASDDIIGYGWGGGVYLHALESSSLIRGNVVYSNTAATENYGIGGGIAVHDSPAGVRLVNNQLLSNTASITEGGGGGLGAFSSVVTITGNLLQGNVASLDGRGVGGGLASSFGQAWIEDNLILDNRASLSGRDEGYGGGVYLADTGFTLQNNEIADNRAGKDVAYGGGVAVLGEQPLTIRGNRVVHNVAGDSDGEGGGIYIHGTVAGIVGGNHILENSATLDGEGRGGGLLLQAGIFTVTNNIVAANEAVNGTGMLVCGETTPQSVQIYLHHNTVADHDGYGVEVGDYASLDGYNNLFANNTVGITRTSSMLGYQLTHKRALFWPDVGGSVPGVDPLVGNPAFVDAANYDYHLQATSAAIDAVPTIWHMVNTDIDGQTRPYPNSGLDDIGADEYPPDFAVLLASDESGSAPAGAQIAYTHHLTNTGRKSDDYKIDVTIDDPSWDLIVDPLGVQNLPPGESVLITATVTVPWSASYGESARAYITATSETDTAIHPFVVDTTTVTCTPPSGFDFSWSPQTPETGETVYFTATLGSGTVPFTYTWGFGDASGSDAQGQQVTHTYVESGTHTVVLTVTNVCDTQVVTHNLTVSGPPFVPTYGVDLNPTTQSREVNAGSSTIYTQTLQNTGDVADTFTVTLSSTQGWATLISPGMVNLEPDARADIEVRITVPRRAASGVSDVTTVHATSWATPTVQAQATLTTSVASWKIYIPLVTRNKS